MAENETPEDLNIERISSGAEENAERDQVRSPDDDDEDLEGEEDSRRDDSHVKGHADKPIDPDSAFSEVDRDDTVDE